MTSLRLIVVLAAVVLLLAVLVSASQPGAQRTPENEEEDKDTKKELDELWEKGVKALSRSEHAAAIPFFEAYLALNPTSPSAINNLALSYFGNRSFARAFFLFHVSQKSRSHSLPFPSPSFVDL